MRFRLVSLVAAFMAVLMLASSAHAIVETSIMVTLSSTEITAGDSVKASGYVTPHDVERFVHIHVDGAYLGLVTADREGYYSKTLTFEEPGIHTVKASADSAESVAWLAVRERAAEETIPLEPSLVNATVIIVRDGAAIYYERPLGTAPESGVGVATIRASAKELDIGAYESNLLKITVTNQLGRDELFSVGSDFPSEMVFLPSPEIVRDGETRVLSAYFMAFEDGSKTEGNIYVSMGGELVKTIPLTVYVTHEQPARKAEAPMIPTGGVLALAFLFLIVLAFVLVRNRLSETVRPLELGDLRRQAPAKPLADKHAYIVPWDNVIP